MTYTLQQDVHELAKSRQVAAAAELSRLRLAQAAFRLSTVPDDIRPPVRLKIEINDRIAAQSKASFDVEVRCRLTATDSKQRRDTVFNIDCVLVATYTVSKPLKTTEIRAFSRGNAVFNCWPYLREFVQSTCARLGLPPFTLPLFKMEVVETGHRGDK